MVALHGRASCAPHPRGLPLNMTPLAPAWPSVVLNERFDNMGRPGLVLDYIATLIASEHFRQHQNSKLGHGGPYIQGRELKYHFITCAMELKA